MLCSAYRGSFYLGRGSAVPKCLVETGCSFGYLMFTSVACEHLKSIMFIAYLHGDSSVQKFMSCLTRNIFIVMLSLRYGLRGLVFLCLLQHISVLSLPCGPIQYIVMYRGYDAVQL